MRTCAANPSNSIAAGIVLIENNKEQSNVEVSIRECERLCLSRKAAAKISEQMIFFVQGLAMETAQTQREVPYFVVSAVAEQTEYSDQRIIVTLIDPQGRHLRLHLTAATGELLCERFADALESRYGQ